MWSVSCDGGRRTHSGFTLVSLFLQILLRHTSFLLYTRFTLISHSQLLNLSDARFGQKLQNKVTCGAYHVMEEGGHTSPSKATCFTLVSLQLLYFSFTLVSHQFSPIYRLHTSFTPPMLLLHTSFTLVSSYHTFPSKAAGFTLVSLLLCFTPASHQFHTCSYSI